MSIKPPRPTFPPLNALRAFEVAARLGGIAKAADELCVTPGAVAQQIKSLEDWAGAPVFRRQAKGVVLSDLGQSCAREFEAAFDLLALATQHLRTRAAPNDIRIAALPSLAQLWLAPRMPALRAAFPKALISIAALEQCPNMARDGYDIAIFLEPIAKTQSGSQRQVLALDQILPVCAPGLAGNVKTPADLADTLWLKDSLWHRDWQIWLEATGTLLPTHPQSLSFTLYALAVAEACAGAGILMGHDMLVAPQLDSGALVAPLGRSVATGKAVTARLAPQDRRVLPREIVAALAGGLPVA